VAQVRGAEIAPNQNGRELRFLSLLRTPALFKRMKQDANAFLRLAPRPLNQMFCDMPKNVIW
jgi:hypothetical protein